MSEKLSLSNDELEWYAMIGYVAYQMRRYEHVTVDSELIDKVIAYYQEFRESRQGTLTLNGKIQDLAIDGAKIDVSMIKTNIMDC